MLHYVNSMWEEFIISYSFQDIAKGQILLLLFTQTFIDFSGSLEWIRAAGYSSKAGINLVTSGRFSKSCTCIRAICTFENLPHWVKLFILKNNLNRYKLVEFTDITRLGQDRLHPRLTLFNAFKHIKIIYIYYSQPYHRKWRLWKGGWRKK